MRIFHFRSITSRIVFLHAIVIATIAVSMPFILLWLLNAETTNIHNQFISDQANRIARRLTLNPDGSFELNLPPELRAEYSSDYGRYSFDILDNTGRLIFNSRRQTAPIFPFDPKSPELSFQDVQQDKSIISGGTLRKNFDDRTVWVQVGEDLAHRDVLTDDIVADFFRRVGWITIPILLLLLTTDILIFRRALRPLLQASSDAAKIGPSRTDIRLPQESIPAEILRGAGWPRSSRPGRRW